MNLKLTALAVMSLLSAILIAFLTGEAILAIIPGVFLFMMKFRYSIMLGFAESFLSFMAIYLEYPLKDVSSLSSTIGGIIGLPSILIILIYPLLAGIITAFSALLFSGVYELIKTGKSSQNPS